MRKLKKKEIYYILFFVVVIGTVFVIYQRSQICLKSDGIVRIEVGETYSQRAQDYLDLTFYFPFEKENISKTAELHFEELKYIDKEEKLLDVGDYKGVLRYQEKDYQITLQIVDTTSPTIEIQNEIPYNQKNFQILDYVKVSDNSQKECQVEVVEHNIDIHKIGEYHITVSAIDAYGNQSKKESTLKVVDKTAPTIKNGDDVFITVKDDFQTLEGLKAIDDVDGDCSQLLQVEGTVDTSQKGIYELTYTVSDKAGNTAKKTRKVYVCDAAYRIDKIPMIQQLPGYYNGCESASATMLLQSYGYSLSMAEMVKSVPTIPLETHNGRLYGADPNEAFTGSMSAEGYGIFAKPMETVIQGWIEKQKGQHKVKNITGASVNELLYYVNQGYPVQVWATVSMTNIKYSSHKTWYIKTLSGHYTNQKYTFTNAEHSLLLIGYTKNTVIFNDPLRGTVEYDLDVFQSAYEGMGKQALILTK